MTTYWHMQIHPDDTSFADEHLYSILENKKIIGLGDWPEGESSISTFRNEVEVNDIVAIKNGARLIALVQIIGGTYTVLDDKLEEESLNQSHQIIIVAVELDPSTERIVYYLSKNGISINVLFFKVFQHGDEQFLSRVWLIDPSETQTNAALATTGSNANTKEPWNGEFYVSFGGRIWEEARRYGFISAGGGSWYSQTLKQLQPGDRVWVKIPATGYVGVGIVQSTVEPASSFTINTDDGEKLAMDILKYSELYQQNANAPDKSEYFVPVKWLETRDEQEAVNEVGFFGNQNTVCKPTTPKWRHTVEKLKRYLTNWDAK
ncbi:hypothetical protein ONR64_14035 [Proteus mirabilis]|uniref:hypothetical protein n=2 Tax=Bacteria TaxID=2 RepID=UPI001F43CFF7|nr:hypothetical protein [Proteus mirabilis]MCL8560840.1 hypothetical protein [Proteus mirabilis]MCW9694092.1 hypothetical protein [Proteus mirabilis]MDC5896965.1 hypothetical protein [Proteus mirabilis]MDC5900442.1 hypothetical protein [Proteus mirabilis]MDC5918098.1 hypothetical protein [Proteus mirabilis]